MPEATPEPPSKPRQKRAPRRITCADYVLTPAEAAQVRPVRAQAKKLGRDFELTVEEEWRGVIGYLPVLIKHRVSARTTRRKTVPRSKRAKCGARTRAGGACKAPTVAGRKRCRMHGGASTGPRSEAGREAIRESNRRRAAGRAQAAST